jgi:hypothetical protein
MLKSLFTVSQGASNRAPSVGPSALRGVRKYPLGTCVGFYLPTVDALLAGNAEFRPWHGQHSLSNDPFAAIQTDTVRPILKAQLRSLDLSHQVRITDKLSDGKLTFSHQLNLVKRIRRLSIVISSPYAASTSKLPA